MILNFTHDLGNLVLLALNFIQTILVLLFTFVKVALIDLYFLIKDVSFLISAYELSAQNVSFRHHQIIFFLEFLTILLALFNNLMKLFDLFRAVHYFIFFLIQEILIFAQYFLLLLNLIILFAMFFMLLQNGILFLVNFFLQLRNLMVHDLVFFLKGLTILLGLSQVLGVYVSITAYSLVQALLLFQLGFGVHVLLLEFRDQIIFQFDLFERVIILGISLSRLNAIFLFFFFQNDDVFLLGLNLFVLTLNFVVFFLEQLLLDIDFFL